MSNKIPKASVVRGGSPMMEQQQLAAMQHQLHLQTLDIISKVYANAISDADDAVIKAVRAAVVNLLEPFQPQSPVITNAIPTLDV